MALTETEKLQSKMLLGVPANARYDFPGDDPDTLLGSLSAAQETEVKAILGQWNTLKLDADKINAEGLDSNPARTEAKLRRLLALAIGYRFPGGGQLRIARG